MSNFQVAGGNGRGYFPLSKQSLERENKRREALRSKGHAWVDDEPMPNADGFVMGSKEFAEFMSYLSEKNDGKDYRLNYKFRFRFSQNGEDTTKDFEKRLAKSGVSIKLEFDSVFGQWNEGDQKQYLSLREFKNGETGGKAETKSSPPPKDESVFEDDDMPF